MRFAICSIIIVLFFSLANAEDLKPLDLNYYPSQGDLKAFMNYANQRMEKFNKPRKGLGCETVYDANYLVHLGSSQACFILPESTIKKLLIAKNDTVEFRGQQNNDAPLWGTPSDDIGYTLGVDGEYSRENAQRKWVTEIKSDLFTKKMKDSNGKSAKSQDGRYYIETEELIRLDFRYEEKTSDPSTRYVGEAGINYRTNRSDGPAAKAQMKWHDSLGEYKNLRYSQVKVAQSHVSGDAKLGIKKIVQADISQFKCTTSVTVMAGVDTDAKPLVATNLEAQVTTGSMGGREEETPLFAIKMIQEQEFRGRERTSATEVEAGSYIWANKEGTSVYLGLGRVVLKSPTNTTYTRREEPIHSVYFRVKKAFREL